MNIKRTFIYLFLIISIAFISCGKKGNNFLLENIIISGSVDLSEADNVSGPVFVMVTNTDNIDLIENFSMETVLSVITVGPGGLFSFSLSDLGIVFGQQIYLMAFVDNDYTGGMPLPTEGDWLGIYFNENTWQTAYVVGGENEELNIRVNRRVYNYTAFVDGVVRDDEAGDLTILAYAGKIDSMNMSSMNVDHIIGYQRMAKPAGDVSFNMRILPYFPRGKDIPLEDVYIIAFLDKNRNGIPDAGDKMGFYTENEHMMPSYVTINEGVLSDINIVFTMEIYEPSGYNISIEGNFTSPAGYDQSSPPIFILIAETDNPEELLNNPIGAVKEFRKVNAGDNSFNIDLSHTDLVPGDEVMVIALWDKDYDGNFPNPTPGDIIGYYINIVDFKFALELTDGVNIVIPAGDWEFDVNKEIYDFDAEVRGTINESESGEVILVAYAGEIESLNLSSIDADNIIGYTEFTKPAGAYDYSLSIMPYGKNVPIEDVYIMGIFDKNGNGLPDGGDMIGYYQDADGMPIQVTINEGVLSGIDIEFTMEIEEPSGYTMSIEGNFTSPAGYGPSSPPVFIMIAETDDLTMLFSDPFSIIKEFQKVGAGENSFDIDISHTALIPGDEVIVIALWDKDYDGGFPNPTPGDMVGYFQNTDVDNFDYTVDLFEGVNSVVPAGDWEFSINKIIYDYETTVEFKIDPNNRPGGMSEDHDLIAIAVYHEGVNDGGFYPDYMINDINYALGMSVIPYRVDSGHVYTLQVMNAIDERITSTEYMDVYIYVIYDRDGDGMPSTGDDIAAYWENKYWGLFPFGWWIDQPKKWNLESDAVNVLTEPDPYAVKFLGMTY